MLVYEDGSIVGSIGGGALEHRAIAAAVRSIHSSMPERLVVHLTRDLGMCCGGAMEVFIEPLMTRSDIVVFGAGHVAQATAPMLDVIGFNVTIVDERPEFATTERFSSATVLNQDPLSYLRGLEHDSRAHFLVVTHDHKLDQELVEHLLTRPSAWLGMIGSRAKVARFKTRFRAAGMDESLFAKLSAPVGLDIGAETPSEIAVAIAGELVRIRRGHDGACRPLRERP